MKSQDSPILLTMFTISLQLALHFPPLICYNTHLQTTNEKQKVEQWLEYLGTTDFPAKSQTKTGTAFS